MAFRPIWNAEVRERVGRLYLTTDRPLQEIALETGVPAGTVSGWAVRYRWRRPREAGRVRRRRAARMEAERERMLAPPDKPQDGDLAARLEAVAVRAIAGLERQVASGRPLDPERTAKALASLTQTLKAIAGLAGRGPGGGEGDDADAAPRPLAELLAELEGHRRRLRAERRPRPGRGDVQPA